MSKGSDGGAMRRGARAGDANGLAERRRDGRGWEGMRMGWGAGGIAALVQVAALGGHGGAKQRGACMRRERRTA